MVKVDSHIKMEYMKVNLKMGRRTVLVNISFRMGQYMKVNGKIIRF